jgi:hypothetical protein
VRLTPDQALEIGHDLQRLRRRFWDFTLRRTTVEQALERRGYEIPPAKRTAAKVGEGFPTTEEALAEEIRIGAEWFLDLPDLSPELCARLAKTVRKRLGPVFEYHDMLWVVAHALQRLGHCFMVSVSLGS